MFWFDLKIYKEQKFNLIMLQLAKIFPNFTYCTLLVKIMAAEIMAVEIMAVEIMAVFYNPPKFERKFSFEFLRIKLDKFTIAKNNY